MRGQTDEAALHTILDVLAPSGLIICSQNLEQTIRQKTELEIVKESVQHHSAILMGRTKPAIPALTAQQRQVVLVSLVEIIFLSCYI